MNTHPLTMPIPEYFEEILDSVRDDTSGEVAQYISQLKNADPNPLALAMCTVDGHIYGAGDDEHEFTMQSISKPFAYALALQEHGPDNVFAAVGLEPSGEAFNELSLDGATNRPMNPMINAGAIAVNQLINGVESSVEDRVEKLRSYFSQLAGRELTIDRQLSESEIEGADRNLSIAHMLRNYDVIEDDAHDAVLSYTLQCSVKVTARDLAVMTATLAAGGIQPLTGEKLVDARVARLVLSMMASAGMYDEAGQWLATVGIPAKSGVSGGLMGVLPGQLGLATFSPRLNKQGNPVRGVEIFKRLSEDMGLHLMSAELLTQHAVRSIEKKGQTTVIQLQGAMNFSAAENFLFSITEHEFSGETVILDISRVPMFRPMGRRMIKEGLRRIRDNGFRVAIFDPDELLPDLEFSDGTECRQITSPEQMGDQVALT
ncbi:Glutaminase 2 [Corynebacterium faecale]|uniref:glutaminase n=1 Tax=Corynebacterium faecale TaxID=1758466 RepID=UPI0025B2BAD5|nr:glutaminase [Corynebacterium faecale]WJY92976.1 Glutaminase 2 [Corynebacterium faecale]